MRYSEFRYWYRLGETSDTERGEGRGRWILEVVK